MKFLKQLFTRLFSTSAAGVYILLFAVAIAVATFIENDFGTSSARKLIFNAWWFELLLLLFGITLIFNIFRYRMIPNKKWPLLIFHSAFIVVLIGAGVTRYFGSEGMMHIREGSASNTFLSAESYLQFEALRGGQKYRFDEPVLFATLGNNHFKRFYRLGDQDVQVEVLGFMPNPVEVMTEAEDGVPTFQVVIGGAEGREEYHVKLGDRANIYGTLFNFGNPEEPGAFNVKYENGGLFFMADAPYTQMNMAAQTRDTILPGQYRPLELRSLYSGPSGSFVIADFRSKGSVELNSSSPKMTANSLAALRMKISAGGQEQEFFVVGSQGVQGRPRTLSVANTDFAVAYGSREVALPFSIQLHDFIMERYPGTNSASSYESRVTLFDPRNSFTKDQRIYMNHILNYGGYRFFQSSFDQDELGTYLSVNHDAWGTWISYTGYFLLTLGMIMTFFSKKTRFRQLAENLKKMRPAAKTVSVFLLGILLSFATPASGAPSTGLNLPVVDKTHATEFGKLWMQDHRGRMKPMNTFAGEVLRKLSRKESLYGLTAEQVILGMAAYPGDWYDVPLIKLGKSQEILDILQPKAELATYNDFFDANGEYKLRDLVRAAYNKPQRERGSLEKDLLKIDERLNICSMVFSGSFMRVFPVPGDKTNHWQAPSDHAHAQQASAEIAFPDKFYGAYIPTLQKAISDKDWTLSNQLITELGVFQQKNGGAIVPANAKLKAELWLNKMNVFARSGRIYGLLGLVFLGLLFTSVFKPAANLKWPFRIAFGLLALTFALHTLGLAMRWYVSGRAPWSNGYESMIYIGWTTMLAGMIFSRKSMGGLAATSVLASTILMVAGLSWLDPEITPLVPVLKSYWLTIHVSMEAGSYGFLLLGAIIGVLNLIFMIFANQKNRENVYRIIKEMTYISEMTLIGGLFMVSIGTYLGGVWANESWGRYWGWDAKETWALVTILVYTFILHMRFIPGFRGTYAFNLASLFGLASVMMTYFGVNYYLSGLHSYAAGDPVPIPPFVYYTVASLAVISIMAYWRYRALNKEV